LKDDDDDDDDDEIRKDKVSGTCSMHGSMLFGNWRE
jgi:hypothetical protein